MSVPDAAMALHVAAGTAGLLLGPVALVCEGPPGYRCAAGTAYAWAAVATGLTALALVAYDPAQLWWLSVLALATVALATLGRLAPMRRGRHWVRAYAHGQGGAYIALVTAALVVSLGGAARIAAWIMPSVVGVLLIERRVRRIRDAAREPAPRATKATGRIRGS